MYNRNGKSKHILTKLSTPDSKCVFERITKFCKKILYYNGLIKLQISMTNYLGFQYSVTYCCYWSGSAISVNKQTWYFPQNIAF